MLGRERPDSGPAVPQGLYHHALLGDSHSLPHAALLVSPDNRNVLPLSHRGAAWAQRGAQWALRTPLQEVAARSQVCAGAGGGGPASQGEQNGNSAGPGDQDTQVLVTALVTGLTLVPPALAAARQRGQPALSSPGVLPVCVCGHLTGRGELMCPGPHGQVLVGVVWAQGEDGEGNFWKGQQVPEVPGGWGGCVPLMSGRRWQGKGGHPDAQPGAGGGLARAGSWPEGGGGSRLD